jgi:hypothetical protein
VADTENTAQNNSGTSVPGEQLTPIQQEALDMGWVPKEEFDGDPDRWVDAGEFVRRGELFKKIESQSKEMKELRKALNELAKHNAKVREVEYDRALKALKSEKKAALAEADADRVIEIDDQIDLVKDQQRQLQAQQVQQVQQTAAQEIHPELKNWMGRNGWYESNRSMRAWADARGIELAEAGQSPTDVLKTLEKEVKDRFKEKFHNPNRDRAGAVEGNVPRGNTKGADFELSDVEKTIMKTLVDGGHITKEEYIKQLKAVKER